LQTHWGQAAAATHSLPPPTAASLANSAKETNPVSTATHFCIARGLLLLRDQIPTPPIILFRLNQHLLCELVKKNFCFAHCAVLSVPARERNLLCATFCRLGRVRGGSMDALEFAATLETKFILIFTSLFKS